MRDRRFVAEHRGGPLPADQHRLLIKWAGLCARRALALLGPDKDERLMNALHQARAWERGQATVGEARQASLAAIAVARSAADPVAKAAARAVGHAVATAHMADHALGAADYALNAAKAAGKQVAAERKWQDERLPPEIAELVRSARRVRRLKI